MTLAVTLLTAVAGTLALTPFVAGFAEARQLYDAPGEGRRIHSVPVPRLGGIAVFAALLIGVAFAVAVAGPALGSHEAWFLVAVLGGAGVVFGAGLLDDLRGLSAMAKLLAQAAAATIFFWGGFRVPTSFLPLEFGGGADLVVSLILTVLWVATISNAFNLIDGLDGLASGIGVIALACTTAVAADSGRPEILILALATLGALLGFLPYNLHPARIFLGDSGSLTLGAVLAVLTLHGVGDGAVSPLRFVPLVALAVPLVDIVVSTLRRWLRGQPVASADRRHIHHQLVARGYSQVQAVLVLYALTCVLAAWGIAVAMAPPGLALLGVVVGGGVSLAVLLLGFGYLDYHEFVDAAVIVLSAPQRLQRVVRFQIHAGDVARAIGRCGTLGEIREVLCHAAPDFEFLHMEWWSEDTGAFPLRGFGDDPDAVANAWRLDCPVPTLPNSYPLVLRIWCYPTGQFRAFNAERVARVIAPALTCWLQEHPAALVRGPGVHLAPEPHRTAAYPAVSDGNRNGGAETTSEVELLA